MNNYYRFVLMDFNSGVVCVRGYVHASVFYEHSWSPAVSNLCSANICTTQNLKKVLMSYRVLDKVKITKLRLNYTQWEIKNKQNLLGASWQP